MYHPHCELLLPQEAPPMELGCPPHLAAGGPGELNFHLLHAADFLHSLDADPAAAAHYHQMDVMREYYLPAAAAAGSESGHGLHCGGSRSGSLVFGADDGCYYMGGQLEGSPQAAGDRGRKRSRRGGGGHDGGSGVEKKEKQRRLRLSEKFTALMLLIPNRTKEDRATVIADAIEYIRELGRTVEELKLLVEQKRRRRRDLQGDAADAPEAAAAGDVESSSQLADHTTRTKCEEQQLRSTYIQRRSRETFVDVRIVEEEVTVKLTRRRRDNGCLAAAARALDELRLELLHVSGGKIGDCHIYMFNTKSLYYGRSSAHHGDLVELGEAVGIIAGQSIGEPGSELTLRTRTVLGPELLDLDMIA